MFRKPSATSGALMTSSPISQSGVPAGSRPGLRGVELDRVAHHVAEGLVQRPGLVLVDQVRGELGDAVGELVPDHVEAAGQREAAACRRRRRTSSARRSRTRCSSRFAKCTVEISGMPVVVEAVAAEDVGVEVVDHVRVVVRVDTRRLARATGTLGWLKFQWSSAVGHDRAGLHLLVARRRRSPAGRRPTAGQKVLPIRMVEIVLVSPLTPVPVAVRDRVVLLLRPRRTAASTHCTQRLIRALARRPGGRAARPWGRSAARSDHLPAAPTRFAAIPRALAAETEALFLAFRPGKYAPITAAVRPDLSVSTVSWPPRTRAAPTICW